MTEFTPYRYYKIVVDPWERRYYYFDKETCMVYLLEEGRGLVKARHVADVLDDPDMQDLAEWVRSGRFQIPDYCRDM